MHDLIIALTARCGSERFPNKALQEVEGKPVIVWIVERLKKINNSIVVLAVPQGKEDESLVSLARDINVPCFRDPSPRDVVGSIMQAAVAFPEAGYVVRALGDCPFMEPTILSRAVEMLDRFRGDAFAWMLPPETMPVYGAREFPYSIQGWARIDRNSRDREREHTDMWFNRHRDKFKIVYHEPPPSDYFRTYRLELDWPEDLKLIREIAKGVGMLAPINEVNRFLDDHPDIAALNVHRHEKTGPTITHTYKERRQWFHAMEGKPVVDWSGRVWGPKNDKSVPVFCSNNHCLLGYGHNGTLYTREGHMIQGYSRLVCPCGAGKIWRAPIRSVH